jgi:hypothetical protein
MAAANNVPVSVHVRYQSMLDPNSSVQAMNEMLGLAAASGAHAILCHIQLLGLSDPYMMLDVIDAGRKAGLRLTTEVYPFGGTAPPISADYLKWENSDERIGFKWNEIRTEKKPHYTFKDKADFQKYQKEHPGEFVQMEYIDESTAKGLAAMRAAVTFPETIPAADGTPIAWKGKPKGADKLGLGSGVDVWPLPKDAGGQPRTTSTHAIILGKWVREQGALTLMQAIANSTYCSRQGAGPTHSPVQHQGTPAGRHGRGHYGVRRQDRKGQRHLGRCRSAQRRLPLHPRQRRLHLEGRQDRHRSPAGKADPANAKGARGIERKCQRFKTASIEELKSPYTTLGPEVILGYTPKWGFVGAMVNHGWGIGGSDVSSQDFSIQQEAFVTSTAGVPRKSSVTAGQYFYVVGLKNGWQIAGTPTFAYNHNGEDGNRFTFPLGTGAVKVTKFGKLPVKIALQYWYYVASPDNFGPQHLVRLQIAPVVPLPW